MLGSIAGDICGAPWEGGSCPKEQLTLFSLEAGFTDDTVCTIAIASALLDDQDPAQMLRAWASKYPGRGYGTNFHVWAHSQAGPYGSYSNGGSMRVSPVGLLAGSLDDCDAWAEITAAVTHNHLEGLRGACAIAGAVWLARMGYSSDQMRQILSTRYGYDLRPSVGDLINDYRFSMLAAETVPRAIICALEASSWDDAIRNAIAVGGDSDTMACMAGGIAEAKFGLPQQHAIVALAYLPEEMQQVLAELYTRAGMRAPWLEPEQPDTPLQPQRRSLLARMRGWLGK